MSIFGELQEIWPNQDEWAKFYQIDISHFPRPWTLKQWQELNQDHHRLFTWCRGAPLLGLALIGQVKGDDTAHLYKICLLPEWRGKGEAEAFWKEILLKLKSYGVKRIFLEVEVSNVVAQSFYRKIGFISIRIVKGFYSDGENAELMDLML